MPDITPFLTTTTAIMTAVIILISIGAWLVSTQRKINRETVEKQIQAIKYSVFALILLEALITIMQKVKIWD
jgi:uncharacterized membrane protein YhfC